MGGGGGGGGGGPLKTHSVGLEQVPSSEHSTTIPSADDSTTASMGRSKGHYILFSNNKQKILAHRPRQTSVCPG